MVASSTAKLSITSGDLQLLDRGITEISTMADKYVPLISSGIAGPLGVLHLPRLWQKVSLEENGKLASGYPGIGKGYDAMTLAALGLEEQAVRDYIRQSRPTYPQFEAWVETTTMKPARVFSARAESQMTLLHSKTRLT
jgi:hypothetical protein